MNVAARHVQGIRADRTWGCLCGWVQDKPHREHVADMVAAGEVERAEVEQLRAQVAAVRALCEDVQAEDVNDGQTDIDTLWPSAVLAALDVQA